MNTDKYLEDFDQLLEQRAANLVANKKKPKLKITKVPEDLRTVKVKLDIPIMVEDLSEVKYYLQHHFDWSLNEQHISPKEFIVQLCESLEIPIQYHQSLTKQLCFQLIEYIERHTYEFDEPFPLEFPNTEKRKPGRPLKNKQQQTVQVQQQLIPTKTTARLSSRSSLNCPNCQFVNIQAGFDCKQCRLPLQLLESLNLLDPVVQACVNLYEIILQKVGSLSFLARNRKLNKEDFTSLYTLRDRMKEAINPEHHQTVDNLIGQIFKNKGPLAVERTNNFHKRKRLVKTEDPLTESSKDLESQQSFEPMQKEK